jgi:hypothetical protein
MAPVIRKNLLKCGVKKPNYSITTCGVWLGVGGSGTWARRSNHLTHLRASWGGGCAFCFWIVGSEIALWPLEGIDGDPADYNSVGEASVKQSDYTARLARDY